MTLRTYRVERDMIGDRAYSRGEVRKLSKAEAAHLVATGALVEVRQKAEPKLKNKAGNTSANKAEG